MRIALCTSKSYRAFKRQAVDEAIARLGIEASFVEDASFDVAPAGNQAFGFEELVRSAKSYAAGAFENPSVDLGIGIENTLSFIYSANEWYYIICIAMQNKAGDSTATFTSGISVPHWMVEEVQSGEIKLDTLTERLAGDDDPVTYFSGKTLTRKELMVPALVLAFSKLNLEKQS